MAHKKGVGSSRNGRDSQAQRLGLKKFGGERVTHSDVLHVRVSAAPNGNPATTLGEGKTTRFSR